MADLLTALDEVATAAQLGRYVSQLPSGLHLVASPHAAVTPSDYGRLLAFLSIFYEVVIIDLGRRVGAARLERLAAAQRAAERDFVGVLQVRAHG